MVVKTETCALNNCLYSPLSAFYSEVTGCRILKESPRKSFKNNYEKPVLYFQDHQSNMVLRRV